MVDFLETFCFAFYTYMSNAVCGSVAVYLIGNIGDESGDFTPTFIYALGEGLIECSRLSS